MKLSTILMMVFTLNLSATGFGQFSFIAEGKKVREVFDIIEKESNYRFFYNDDLESIDKVVNLKVENKNINQVLGKLLESSDYTYKVFENNLIVVSLKDNIRKQSDFQQFTVKGTITDQKGNPIPGVTVVIKGTTQGTISDVNGNYFLETDNPLATLVFSFIGYKSQEIVIGNKSQININMEEEVIGLEEVVVIGYGTQKKTSVTGALTSMKSEDVKNIVVPNLSNALAGRMSGVFVTQATGAPGYAASIRVRAINTWKTTGLSPLYVIDGVITDKRRFDALDYSEVDNITILKDAASGAIYGARAANGVIIVTTKKGALGKFQLDYNYSYSIDKPSKIPEYVSAKDMVRLNNFARTIRGLTPVFDAEEIAFFDENDPAKAWYTLAYNDPVLQKHSLTASGGTEKVKYFLAGSYFDQTAFIKNADYKKYNFRSNLDINFTKDLTGVFDISYSQGTRSRFVFQEDNDGYDTNINFGGMWGRLLYYLPLVPPKTSDGKFINPGWIGNPLAFIEEGGTSTHVERNIEMRLGLTYKIPFVNGLSVSALFSPNYEGTYIKLYELKTTLYNVVRNGSNGAIYTDEVISSIKSSAPNKERLVKSQVAIGSYQMNFSANYVKKFGKHNVDAILVYEQFERNYDYFYGVREGFPLLQKDQFWATSAERTDSEVGGTENETGRASYIGRLAYNYDERYFVNATVRRDGSMLFAPDFRWGTFPSVSAGWVLSNENFFKVNSIDFLKLRGSWGLAGNDAVGGWKWSESFSTNGTYLFGTAGQPRILYDGIVNEKLTWEKTSEWNIGLDSRLFDHFLLNAEYYKRHNYDILDSRIASLPVSFGGSMPPENYGIVDAHGYELELGYTGNLGDLEYLVKGNFGYSTNKVKLRDVAENAQSVDNPNGRSTDYVKMLVATDIIRTQEELDAIPSTYTIYGLKPTLGSLNFEDVSSQVEGVPDGKIDDYDRQILKGKHYQSPYVFGLNLVANWKGFGADIFLQGITGISKLYNDGYGRKFFLDSRPPSFWLDSWSPDNIDAAYPAPCTNNYTNDHRESTFWLKDGSFLRLQYVNLTYSLPKSICEKIKISDVTFILSGTNLLTLTKYDYHDPSGDSMNSYPTMKSYTMGINVSF